jgi:hypothetical protein
MKVECYQCRIKLVRITKRCPNCSSDLTNDIYWKVAAQPIGNSSSLIAFFISAPVCYLVWTRIFDLSLVFPLGLAGFIMFYVFITVLLSIAIYEYRIS